MRRRTLRRYLFRDFTTATPFSGHDKYTNARETRTLSHRYDKPVHSKSKENPSISGDRDVSPFIEIYCSSARHTSTIRSNESLEQPIVNVDSNLLPLTLSFFIHFRPSVFELSPCFAPIFSSLFSYSIVFLLPSLTPPRFLRRFHIFLSAIALGKFMHHPTTR